MRRSRFKILLIRKALRIREFAISTVKVLVYHTEIQVHSDLGISY